MELNSTPYNYESRKLHRSNAIHPFMIPSGIHDSMFDDNIESFNTLSSLLHTTLDKASKLPPRPTKKSDVVYNFDYPINLS